tara:strand:- start:1483 stop:2121 length:639 start_codon:yes stop_codon:yes gene_type:complete
MSQITKETIKGIFEIYEARMDANGEVLDLDSVIEEAYNWSISKANTGGGDVMFDLFWDAYPRKVGKKTARAKFLKLSEDNQSTAISMINRYKIYAQMYGTDFLHPSTYINQERFLDDDLAAVPTGEQVSNFLANPMRIFGVSKLNETYLIKAAKILEKHKATDIEAKQVAQWMNDVWGSSAEWRQYVNLNSFLNETKWKERVIKAKDYLNGK